MSMTRYLRALAGEALAFFAPRIEEDEQATAEQNVVKSTERTTKLKSHQFTTTHPRIVFHHGWKKIQQDQRITRRPTRMLWKS